MPINTDEINRYLDEEEARRARQAQLQAPAVDPDSMGRAARIARERGMPPLVVAENLPEFDERERLDKVEGLARQNPAIGQWLQQPENAALAADDHDNLTFLDGLMGTLFAPVKALLPTLPVVAKYGLPAAPAPYDPTVGPVHRAVAPDVERSWGDFLSDLGLGTRAMARSGAASMARAPIGAINWLNQAINDDARRLAGLFGQDAGPGIPMLRPAWSEALRDTGERLNAQDAERYSPKQAALEANRPDGFLNTLGYYATHPQLAATDTAGAVSYMAAGGMIPGKAQASLVAMAFSQAQGVVDQVRARRIELGDTPEVAEAHAARAFAASAMLGIVASKLVPHGQAFERFIGGSVQAGKTGVARTLGPLVGEPASEALEEGGIQAIANLGAGDPLGQGVGAAAGQGAVVGTGMAAPAALAGAMQTAEAAEDKPDTRITVETLLRQLAALTPAQIQRGNALLEPLLASAADGDRLAELAAAVDKVKTKQRDRSAMEALVQRMADRVPELPSELYVDARALVELYQSRGEDPAVRVAELVGDARALGDALASTGDLRVPIGRFITSDAREALLPHVRTAPDRLSNAELAQVNLDELAAELTAEDAVASDPAADVPRETPQQQVEDHMAAQLVAQLGVDRGEARGRAKAMAQVYARRAGRRSDGRTAYDLFLDDNLEFRNEEPGAALSRRDPVDAVLDPVIDDVLANGFEPRETARGMSLVQAVIDAGGVDPDSVGAADLRAQGAGKRPGFFVRGAKTVEDLGEKFGEADSPWTDLFTTKDEFNRPDLNEFISLLVDDLQGDRVQLPSSEEASRFQSLRNDVAAVMKGLELRGVNVAAMGRPLLRRMVEAELGTGEYEQPAFHGTHARGIEQFSLQKIGTGEGNQVFGWGLYFASLRGVAEWYRDTVTRQHAGARIKLRDPSAGKVMEFAVGDGRNDFAMWLSENVSMPAGIDEDEFLDLVTNVSSNLEEMIAADGKIPVPAWVDMAARVGDIQADEAPVYLQMINLLRSINAQVAPPGVFVYNGADGLERASVEEVALLLSDEFSDGMEEPEDVDAVAKFVAASMQRSDPAAWRAERSGSYTLDGVAVQAFPELQDVMQAHLESIGLKTAGQVYQVEIPDAEDLLDWDAPLADQPPAVREKLVKALSAYRGNQSNLQQRAMMEFAFRATQEPSEVTGRDVYESLVSALQSQQAASHYLFEHGIPGLRYLDATARGTDKQSHNFVIWDESRIQKTGELYQSAEDQSEQPFYSALLRSVETAKGAPKKADAAAWKQWLDGAQRRGEFKQAERDFMGLDAWLDGIASSTDPAVQQVYPGGVILREQIREFVRANELVLEEKMLGGQGKEADLRDLPFKVGEEVPPSPYGKPDEVWPVIGPTGASMGLFGSRDLAEQAAYDYSAGYLRSQGVSIPQIPRGYLVARATAGDLEAIGLDASDGGVGGWALFEDLGADQNPRDRGEMISSVGGAGLSYAEAVSAAAQEAEEVLGAEHAQQTGFIAPDAPYANLSLPGLAGYRVMLVKMPSRKPGFVGRDRDIEDRIRMFSAMAEDAEAEGNAAEAAMHRETVANLRARNPESRATTEANPEFTGGHFEPNTVAHVRFGEKVDADGKRVLVLLEVQSDWHQQGRKRGYNNPANHGVAFVEETEFGPSYRVRYADGMVRTGFRDLAAAQRAATSDEDLGTVPDAPFKTTWHELVLKRMVRYAAENGFDRIAWPTEAQVPVIEQWPDTAADIRADPKLTQRFGAILDRYATAVPRFMKEFGKKFGAKVVQTKIVDTPADPAWSAFYRELRRQLERTELHDGYAFSVLERVEQRLDAGNGVSADTPLEAIEAAVDEVSREVEFGDGFPEAAEALQAALEHARRVAQAPSSTNPALEITDSMREAALAGLPLFQQANASIQFTAEGVLIRMGEKANLTSLHHEFGHLFLEWLLSDAFLEGADPTLAEDLDTFLAWRGKTVRVKDGMAAVRAAITVPDHEAFAEGYETYLHEGRAPTLALADLFARFRSWMLAVYGALRARRFPIPDEMRRVYDRLYVADAEAEAASEQSGYLPLPDNVAGLVGDVRWQAYQKKLQRARDDTAARLDASVLKPVFDEATAEWKAAREAMEATVLAEAMADPAHRARAILASGTLPDGSEPPTEITLDGRALKAEFGDAFTMDRLRGLYRNQGGQPPALVADMLGFGSAFELVEALANTPPIKVWVKAEADRRLRAQRSDPMNDGSLAEKALRASHGSPRLAALEDELAMVAELAGKPAPTGRELGALARRMVSTVPLRSLRPNDYLRAERKAAGEALKAMSLAEPRLAVALLAKRRQAMNAHLYRAALDRKAAAERMYRYLGRFNKTRKRASLGKVGGHYLEQIDALMEQLDLRPASGPELARRQSLRDYVRRAEARGEGLSVPPAVLDLAERTQVGELTFEQLQGIVDTIRQLDHLARTKGKLLALSEARRLVEVDEANADSVRKAHGARPPTSGDITENEKLRVLANGAVGHYLNASNLARDLDGGVDGGAVWASVVAPIQDANARTELELAAARERLAAIYDRRYTKDELRGLRVAHIRAPDGSLWSRERILALAGNWGNPGNREALLEQDRVPLAQATIDFLLAKMDARDWQLVVDLAGEFERLRPEIAAREKIKTGLVPEWVEFSPFTVTTADGQTLELPGWYWPLVAEKHEARADRRTTGEELDDAMEELRVGKTARAQTRNGSAIERVGFGGRVVQLELGVVHAKLRESIRDIHLGPAVNDVYRILNGRRLKRAVDLAGKEGHLKALNLWLVDVAAGEVPGRNLMETVLRRVRTNASAALLTFKVSTGLLQVTGFAQSMTVIGPKWMGVGAKRIAELDLGRDGSGLDAIHYVESVSPGMKLRGQGHVEQVQAIDRALAGKSRFDLKKHAWWMMANAQRLVDITTFLGAEAQGMELFDNDADKARAYAFDAVERAQGSNDFIGKNAMQRGTLGLNHRQSELVKSTTFMMSYMMAKGQILYVNNANRRLREPANVARAVMDLVNLFVWEVIALAALRGGWPDDEDDDGTIWDEDFALWLGVGVGQGIMGVLPGFSYLASELRGYSPSTTGIAAAQAFGNLLRQIGKGDEAPVEARVKATTLAAGVALGFPSSQANTTIDALWRVRAGEEVPVQDYLVKPPEE